MADLTDKERELIARGFDKALVRPVEQWMQILRDLPTHDAAARPRPCPGEREVTAAPSPRANRYMPQELREAMVKARAKNNPRFDAIDREMKEPLWSKVNGPARQKPKEPQ